MDVISEDVLRKGNWSRESCPEGNTVRASSLLLGDLGCLLRVSELLLVKTRLGRASLHLPYPPKKQKGVRSFMCHCLVDKTLERIVPEVFGAGSRLPEGKKSKIPTGWKGSWPKVSATASRCQIHPDILVHRFIPKMAFQGNKTPKKTGTRKPFVVS